MDSAGTFLLAEGAALDPTKVYSGADRNYPANWYKDEVSATDYQVYPPSQWTSSMGNYSTNDTSNNQSRRPVARHNGGLNVLYCDGHAKWKRITDFLGVSPAQPDGWPYGDPNNSWDNK